MVFGDPGKGKNKLQCEVKGNSWIKTQSLLAGIQFSKVQLLSKYYPFNLCSLSSKGKLDLHFVIYLHSPLIHEIIVSVVVSSTDCACNQFNFRRGHSVLLCPLDIDLTLFQRPEGQTII